MSRLPVLRGRDLTGAARELPGDLSGASVLLLGFAVRHQRELDRWLAALDGVDVPLVEVPVAGRRDEVFARSIEGGMVPGVPADRHTSTVVAYTDRAALVTALGLPGPVPAAVVVDAGGDVLAVHPGGPSAATAADVRRVLAAVA